MLFFKIAIASLKGIKLELIFYCLFIFIYFFYFYSVQMMILYKKSFQSIREKDLFLFLFAYLTLKSLKIAATIKKTITISQLAGCCCLLLGWYISHQTFSFSISSNLFKYRFLNVCCFLFVFILFMLLQHTKNIDGYCLKIFSFIYLFI